MGSAQFMEGIYNKSGSLPSSGVRLLPVMSALLACVALAGCGSGGTFLPVGTPSKSVPGVPAGPTLGYAWSSSDSTLRSIQGVSGSALVGQSIVPAGVYTAGAASAVSGLGLVEDAKGSLFLLDLPSPSAALVATGVPAQAQILFSPSGGAAIAYVAGGTSVVLLTNLASTPKASSLSLGSGDRLAAAAISDAGTVLVSKQGSPVQVGTLSAAGAFARVTTVAQAGGVSFLPGSEDALIADGAGNTVSLLHSVSGSPGVQALAATGVNRPLAVASSQDARWAVIANGGDRNVIWIDLKSGGVPAKVSCSCQPNQLTLLAGGNAFRINDLSSGPVWMTNLTGTTPQLLFVPALH